MVQQTIEYEFKSRMAGHEFAVIPVITPEGHVKHLRVRPDNQPKAWLVMEWKEGEAGRLVALNSVDLTSERKNAGAKFLKDAYDDEGFPEGFAEYERYIAETYRLGAKNRPDPKLHFPAHLLPKYVVERQEATELKKAETEYSPSRELQHPADKAKTDGKAKASANR